MSKYDDDPIDLEQEEYRKRVPKQAYRKADVAHIYLGQPFEDFDYSEYKFVGRMPRNAYPSVAEARPAAKSKFGDNVKVFATGRFWVVYQIQ